ncbi:hypothetical protein SLEP1_g55346 [Rubroshorea leprosula]|uniref:Uncharacterized protein n=1 Tax=Rubroshorea leprosula TaxID=152421 RepID=A0AAV5MFG5_9ROSI|nr:hypothetical protein SLEP1_g55346 [Rubroshorea leprosula]
MFSISVAFPFLPSHGLCFPLLHYFLFLAFQSRNNVGLI